MMYNFFTKLVLILSYPHEELDFRSFTICIISHSLVGLKNRDSEVLGFKYSEKW